MVRKLLVPVSAAVVALAICEIGLRFLLGAAPFAPEPGLLPYMAPEEAPLRWRFAPEAGRNRLGFRNREIGPKPEGTKRVLFLGDSLLWGSGTSSGQLYTRVLEERWTAVRGAPVETINAGVPGYTTFQELALLRIHGLALEPDHVVLGFVLNDLAVPYLHRPDGERLLGREPSARLGRLDPDGLAGRWLGWSYLAHEVGWRAEVLRRKLAGDPVPVYETREDFYLAWRPWAWPPVEALLREMKELLDARGVPLLLVVHPMRGQFEALARGLDPERVLYPQRRLEDICARLGIARLDVTGAIAEAGGAALFRDHVHLAPRANDLVGERIGERLDPLFRRVGG